MFHPELVDGCEIDFSLELVKIPVDEKSLDFLEFLSPELGDFFFYLLEIDPRE